MTENEKARELIATSETTVKVDPQNGWYLKRFAALQFEGSVDNFSTNMPIHVLEQQLPKDDTMKLDDAVIEGQDFDYSKFYDERGNESSNNLDDIENIADTLNCCADYGATVARKEAERQEAYSYLEGKDLCSRVTEINSFIASLGFGLMTSVGMLNTLCRMAGVPLIAENVEVGNLETFVAFAKEVVDSYFTTGPVGSVSES